ncbi:ABC transporter ATP-binding protein [bacterium]|nr:ABC transporter ATP-binding protein [bacterium]
MRSVTLKNVFKSYNSESIIKNLDLQVPSGKFFALLGPSGCGKTTILRMIAGFEKVDQGSIYLGQKDITHMPINERNIHTVFQNYALFPHLNVFDNVAYSLRLKKESSEVIEHKVMKTLKKFQLEAHRYKSVQQLSGGQQQRVAIARVVINEPDVLLLDEPLAALDLRLREKVLLELIELQDELKTTFIYVTHDQTEALTVADQMAIMNPYGQIEQIGSPKDIYEFPRSTYVAKFVGSTNILQGYAQEETAAQHDGKYVLRIDGLPAIAIPKLLEGASPAGEMTYLSVRPEKIMISKRPLDGFSNCLQGMVLAIVYHGRSTQYNVRLQNGLIVQVFEQNEEHFPKDVIDYDDQVFLYWQKDNGIVLAE